MNVLFQNMLPVIIACLAGWGLGRRHKLDLRTLGSIVVFAIAPLVNFDAVLKAPAETTMFALPLFAFIIGGCNSWFAYWSSRLLVRAPEHILLTASSASSANTLYYGLGLALALLPKEQIAPFLLGAIGFSLSESLFGYYFLARNHFHWRAALGRVVRLPVPYAILSGIVIRNLFPTTELLQLIAPLAGYARGALILLGSMILGTALAQEQRFRIVPRLVATVLFSRHVSFALITATLLALDALGPQLIAPAYHRLFLLFAIMPIANNTLTFATILGLPTAAISSTIIISNGLALVLAALACGLPG